MKLTEVDDALRHAIMTAIVDAGCNRGIDPVDMVAALAFALGEMIETIPEAFATTAELDMIVNQKLCAGRRHEWSRQVLASHAPVGGVQ